MSVVARRLVIRGRVQGVGYRDATVQAAFECGVHGWARNRADGTVEVLLQGESEAVERMIGWCRRGPPLARVEVIEAMDVEIIVSLRTFERLGYG
jgi:acylphosphatase